MKWCTNESELVGEAYKFRERYFTLTAPFMKAKGRL